MLRRKFAKVLAGLGISSKLVGSASAKSEGDSLRIATHKDENKSERKQRYRLAAESEYEPTSYYIVQLTEKKDSNSKITEVIDKKNSNLESLIENTKATTGRLEEILPGEMDGSREAVRYKGKIYEPVVIETGDVPERMANKIVAKANSDDYGV